MPDSDYFACSRLHTTMRVDRCNEARAAGRQTACVGCTSWPADQLQTVQIDLQAIELSPLGVRQRHVEHRTSITWKPDTTLTADPTTVFSYKPLPMPEGWDRWKLSKQSSVSYHTWERYFAGESLRVSTYERAEAFLKQLARDTKGKSA